MKLQFLVSSPSVCVLYRTKIPGMQLSPNAECWFCCQIRSLSGRTVQPSCQNYKYDPSQKRTVLLLRLIHLGKRIFRFGVFDKSGRNLSKPVACLLKWPGSNGFHASQRFVLTCQKVCNLSSAVSLQSLCGRESLQYLFRVMLSTRSRHLKSSQRPDHSAIRLRL